MNITITGNLGSGKTSVCNVLKEKGYEIISTGSLFRQIAEEKGLTVVELNELAKTDRSVDDMLDQRSIKLGKEKDNTVFDSRMAWNFVPESFKVFLLTDIEEAAKRVLNDTKRNAETYKDINSAMDSLKKRALLEKDRFQELYHVNYYNASNYNLIIETTDATPEEIAEEICRNFDLYQKKPFIGKVELNPSSLYPTQAFRDFSQNILFKYYQEEKNNNSLCCLEAALLTEKNGYFYLLDGHHHTFAAASTGKKFIEVDFNFSEKARNAIIPNQKAELYDFEDLGHFRYRQYPIDDSHKIGYMIDWPQKDIEKSKNHENTIEEH